MRLPRIAHVAMNALDPQRILDFYLGIFGSRQLRDTPERRMQGKLNRFAGDGVTNLAIHLFYSDFEGHEARFGINHFGFLVDDQAERVRRLKESYLVAERPEQRPYAEFRFRDPDGNALDLSQTKGWEVDTGKWITAA
jgi:catechol 2,3-dioxygenase-like lactoylglutathione lyase family enzyme